MLKKLSLLGIYGYIIGGCYISYQTYNKNQSFLYKDYLRRNFIKDLAFNHNLDSSNAEKMTHFKHMIYCNERAIQWINTEFNKEYNTKLISKCFIRGFFYPLLGISYISSIFGISEYPPLKKFIKKDLNIYIKKISLPTKKKLENFKHQN